MGWANRAGKWRDKPLFSHTKSILKDKNEKITFNHCGVACGSSTPEEVAKNYVNAILEGDSKTAISYLNLGHKDDNEYTKGKIAMGVNHIKKEIDEKGGVKSITVQMLR